MRSSGTNGMHCCLLQGPRYSVTRDVIAGSGGKRPKPEPEVRNQL